MALTPDRFTHVYVIDFEYQARDGEQQVPVAMVAKGFKKARDIRMFFDQPQPCPFTSDPDTTLFIGFNISSEYKCFLALGWQLPKHSIDLYVEYRNLTCGVWRGKQSLWELGTSLVNVVKEYEGNPAEFWKSDKHMMQKYISHYGVNPPVGSVETVRDEDGAEIFKDFDGEVHVLDRANPEHVKWYCAGRTQDEHAKMILDYCEEDVVATHFVARHIMNEPAFNFEQALHRGSYTRAVAHLEHNGLIAAIAFVAAAIAGGLYYRSHRAKPLTDKDTIVLGDFSNSTGDPVFDDTLKTALGVSLRQSPFLNVLSDSNVAKTLRLMTRPPDTKLTPDVARELCQRAGGKAYIAGSIASLGSQYVLGLKAVNCESGNTLAEEQVTAAAKEKVLDALGEAASKVRGELGESLASVQKLDVPLAQATTSSLEALQAYSRGWETRYGKGSDAALPFFRRAVQLDPSFAMGYRSLAGAYANLGELGQARENDAKAFELREHASEREKLLITSDYYSTVSGERDKAARACRELIDSYPRDAAGYLGLGNMYASQGEYERATELVRQGQHLKADSAGVYADLASHLIALQRFEEAQKTVQEAHARKLEDFVLHNVLYALAFLGAESLEVTEQEHWFASNMENNGLSLASDTEAYGGHRSRAWELTRLSVDSALRAESKETGAIWWENAALREAAFGYQSKSRQAAVAGLKIDPASLGVGVEAALAYAVVGGHSTSAGAYARP